MGRGIIVFGASGAGAIKTNAARIMEQYSPILPSDLQVILIDIPVSRIGSDVQLPAYTGINVLMIHIT